MGRWTVTAWCVWMSLTGCAGVGGERWGVERGVRAEGLRCQGLDTPPGVEAARPRLSWEVRSAAGSRAVRQTAYQLRVAGSAEALADGGARGCAGAWDSGKVEAGESWSEYGGPALASGDACWWSVRLWDESGRAGAWSKPARWEMGLLGENGWGPAAWIDAGAGAGGFVVRSAVYGAGDLPRADRDAADVTARVAELAKAGGSFVVNNDAMGADPAFGKRKRLVVWGDLDGRPVRVEEPEGSRLRVPRGSVPYLRRAFEVSGPVARARVYATALGVYELTLNGAKVGDQSLAPGWTDYRKRVRYQVYDITERLTPGAHALGAVVAPGWFAGHAGLFGAYGFYGERPALRLVLDIEYADGRRERVVTDGDWTRHDGPWAWADLMDGEVYDARAAIDGWDTPGFDDSAWDAATTREENRVLEADICEPVRVLAELPAVALTEPQPGRWTFDLGQNMVGVARLKIDAPPGTAVTLRHGEMLNPDGTVYTGNLRAAPSTDVYVCRGSGRGGGGGEEWRPSFTFHGFRYVEVTGLTERPSLDTVTGIVLGTDTPVVGEFACSDDRVNQLQSNIVWGMRGNFLSVPTDCPQRDERMGWMADAQVFLPTALYNADAAAFMRKWTADVRDAQREDGAHSDVAPATFGLTYGSPAWADAGVIVPWEVYRATGDAGVLAENAESMKAWVAWCRAHSTGLIRDRDRGNDYGDWLSIGADTPKDLIGTAYFAHSADLLARSMAVLGRTQEAAEARALFEDIRAAFNARYVGPDARVHGDTQTAFVLALRFGLLDDATAPRAVERLVADIESKGWKLSTGFVGVSHLLHVLEDHGRADVAARLLLQDEFPSWLFSVKHGATTIWERWNGWTPQTGPHPDVTMNSFNHYALGSCGRWLYEGVAGLRPLEPGWARAEFRPTATDAFQWARARHRSVRGQFATAWRWEEGRGGAFVMEVEVPANATGVVWLPVREAQEDAVVTESGMPVAAARGISTVDAVDGWVRLEVGSGEYRFRVE
jgi:alpha-L-rhamnosidase